MAALYDRTKGAIHSIARKYRGWAELEDLEQEGYLGLCDAVEGYNPDEGVLFLTYAHYWIRQKIIRYCQNHGTLVRVPVRERELLRKYRKLESAFLSQTGRKPSDAEIQRHMGIAQRTLDGLRKAAQMGQLESLDAFLLEDRETTLGDMVDAGIDVEGDVLDKVQAEELRAVIWPLVDGLGVQRAAVIRSRYQAHETGREIGARMGIGVQRVSQIEKEALRELRKKRHLLRPFLPDDLGSLAYAGNVGAFQRTWTSSTERAAMRL